jgi:DNA-directed RNA polymerase subunit omega
MQGDSGGLETGYIPLRKSTPLFLRGIYAPGSTSVSRVRDNWKVALPEAGAIVVLPPSHRGSNMSERVRNNAQYAIPDDPELSTYRFIIVAAKRARQLQNGARSFLPTTSKKPTVASMEEVRRGLVKYFDPMRAVPVEEEAAE